MGDTDEKPTISFLVWQSIKLDQDKDKVIYSILVIKALSNLMTAQSLVFCSFSTI